LRRNLDGRHHLLGLRTTGDWVLSLPALRCVHPVLPRCRRQPLRRVASPAMAPRAGSCL